MQTSTKGSRSYGAIPNPEVRPHGTPSHRERHDIYLIGLGHPGKSCIFKTIFENMRPQDAIFQTVTKTQIFLDLDLFSKFRVIDVSSLLRELKLPQVTRHGLPLPFPGTVPFSAAAAIIIVHDAKSTDKYEIRLAEFSHVIKECRDPSTRGTTRQPNIHIFLHKIDQYGDRVRQEMNSQFQDDLEQAMKLPPGMALRDFGVNFHLTSVHNSSAIAAFSQVAMKLIPQHDLLMRMLTDFVTHSGLLQAAIFDTKYNLWLCGSEGPFNSNDHNVFLHYLLLLKEFNNVLERNTPYGLTASSASLTASSSFGHASEKRTQGPPFGVEGTASRMIFSNNSAMAYWHLTGNLALIAWIDIPASSRLKQIDADANITREAILQVLSVERRVASNIPFPLEKLIGFQGTTEQKLRVALGHDPV